MSIDWDKVEAENKSEFKDFAPEGNYKTKIKKVELIQSSKKKTPGLQFTFEDNEQYAFPRFGATHWLSFNNDSWRQHHFKEILVVLGIAEDKARKSIELCEDQGSQEKIVDKYEEVFKKAVSKAKAVEVVVFKRTPDAQYNDCDFADNKVRMNRPEKQVASDSVDDILDEGEEVKEDLDSIPF